MVEEENLFITKTGNEIVTDAGWEKISFEQDLRNWHSAIAS
jgi:hypothetical protein